MANAKKSLSSCQLSRDLGLPQKTCWRIMMAIRAEMGKDNVLLQGIVEADETYIGGKRKKDYDKEIGEPRKRGRGTAKDVVLGVVARGGKVVAELVGNVKGSTIAEFIKTFVKTDDSELYTDQYKGYNEIGKQMKHETMNRSQKWEPTYQHNGRFLVFRQTGVVWITSPLFNSIHPLVSRRGVINTTTEKLTSL